MFTIIMSPPMLPPGEYRYACADEDHLRRVGRALVMLSVDIIDVERDGESLTQGEFGKIMTG